MDPLQVYSSFSLLTFAGSLLAVLGLRIVTGSSSQQIELIREFLASFEQTSRTCMRARSAALSREFETHETSWNTHCGNIIPIGPRKRIHRNYVQESDRLIRTLTSITQESGDMRLSRLQRCISDLKRVERESTQLLAALEAGQ